MRQRSDQKTGNQAGNEGGMTAARSAARFCEADENRCGNQKGQKRELKDGHSRTVQDRLPVGSFQGIPPVQEEHPAENSSGKASQTEQGVAVPTGQAENHAEGAAQKHQTADHNEEAQNKAEHGAASAPGGKLPGNE